MTKLVTCLDCGQQISQTASVCPKCHTDRPHGVKCSACAKGSIPKKDALYNSVRIERGYYHPECVRRILDVPDNFICADCGIRVNRIWDWQKIFNASNIYGLPCPNCGRPDFMGRKSIYPALGCGTCRLPLLGFHKIIAAYSDSTHDIESYHDLCATESVKEKDVSKRKLQRESHLKKSNLGCTTLMFVIFLSTLLFILK